MSDGPFAWPIRIYYEDTDVSGVVYHANYLRFFERARTEWLRHLGLSQERLMQDENAAFTLSDVAISFRVPARLDEELEATVEVAERRRASIRFVQKLKRPGVDGQVLATAQVRVGCVDTATFKPRLLPTVFASIAVTSVVAQTSADQQPVSAR